MNDNQMNDNQMNDNQMNDKQMNDNQLNDKQIQEQHDIDLSTGDLKMHLMKWTELTENVSTGEINVSEILNVPSRNKQVTYNLTFTEHVIQSRVNGETGQYLLDCLVNLLDMCTDKINEYMNLPIVSLFIVQILKEWNLNEESKHIFMKNDEELLKVEEDDACPTLMELKTYEQNMHSKELEDIVNSIEDLRKEKEDLEHNALKARVEMNYLNCKFHPMGLNITKIEDAEQKRDKIVEMCEKCNDFQKRIKKCIKNYEILLNYDSYIYNDTIIDLSTRDNYKYNEYIRLLIKNGKADKNILNTLNDDLDKIENIEIVFSNILYLSNFIKKERLYTLNILRMYLDDINSNYLSDNCDMSKLKKQLDDAVVSIKPQNIVDNVANEMKNKVPTLNYNDALKSRINDKINKKRESLRRPVQEPLPLQDPAPVPVPVPAPVPAPVPTPVQEKHNQHYIKEAQILDDAAEKNLIAAKIDNPERADLMELEKLKKLRGDIEKILQGLNSK